MTFMPLAFFQSRGKAHVPTLAYAIEFVVFVPLLYFAVAKAGVIGAAGAWVFRTMLDGIILYWAANRVTVYWKN
ncbi:hypothetical protein L2D77_33080, partial [Pseudomonas aeruginosa]|nr:hypothetical protein [Pseudomonas aeruginosa]